MLVITSQAESGPELQAEADAALTEFEQWFITKLDNQALTPSEKAILKTFIHWAVVGSQKG